MVKKRRLALLLSCVFILIAVILMLVPGSTALTFAPRPGEKRVVFYSYFSVRKLLSYANFGPPVTAVLSVIWLALSQYTLARNNPICGYNLCFVWITLLFSIIALATTGTRTTFGYLICFFILLAGLLQLRLTYLQRI